MSIIPRSQHDHILDFNNIIVSLALNNLSICLDDCSYPLLIIIIIAIIIDDCHHYYMKIQNQ